VLISLVVAAVLNGRVMLGLGGACALLLIGSVRINPIQVGLEPVTRDPLMLQIQRERVGHESAAWAVLGAQAGHARSILAASGAPTATHVSWYADPAAWTKLDPTSDNRNTWDRFAMVSMDINDELPGIDIALPVADQIVITTPTCDAALQKLDITYVITEQAAEGVCLQLVDEPHTVGERYIYRVR